MEGDGSCARNKNSLASDATPQNGARRGSTVSAFEREWVGGDLFAKGTQMVGQRDPCPDTLGAGVHAESVGPLCFLFPTSGTQVSGWLSYANSNVSCATCQEQASCKDPFPVSSCLLNCIVYYAGILVVVLQMEISLVFFSYLFGLLYGTPPRCDGSVMLSRVMGAQLREEFLGTYVRAHA